MLKSDAILREWVSSVDLTNTRIKNFPSYIFLCGGKLSSPDANSFGSCRDVFYSYVQEQTEINSQNFVLAEKIIDFFDESGYPDLLTFEKDLAEISLLTIVFSESAGSIAELGSFSVLENIKNRLLLVLHEDDAAEKSFIWRGPIKYLSDLALSSGFDEPIYVYNWRKEQFKNDGRSCEKAFPDISDLYEQVGVAISKRKNIGQWNRRNVGHVMLLLASSLNVMRVATVEELRQTLELFDLGECANNVDRYLRMLIIGFKRYGNSGFYLGKDIEWLQWSYNGKNSDFLWNNKFVEFYNMNQEKKKKVLRSVQNNDY